MHVSTNQQATSRATALWRAALCAAAVMVATSSYADDDRGRRDKRGGEHRSWAHEHGRDHHRDRHRDHRSWERGHARDWRSYDDRRYYADAHPPLHRHGRRCADRRHYHAVHYHVAARDYYDYYYPRYRHYGPAPLSAHASVILTLPLF
jgi:hypothetical protein